MKKHFLWSILLFCIACQTTPQKTNNLTKPTAKSSQKVRATEAMVYQETLEPFPPDTIDGILVKVGTEPILLSDLNQARTLYPQQPPQALLDALIDAKIMEIKSRDLGLDVSEDELTKYIADFLQKQNLTETELEAELERNQKSMADYRADFKKEVIKQLLIGRVISPYINVTNTEVSRFYLQQTKNVKQVSRVKLRSLLISVPDDYSGEILDYEMVQKIREQVAKKADFVDLVRSYSGALDATTNLGILPPKKIEELPEELQKQLVDLQIDQVVGPLAFGNSVFFFQYLGADFTADSDLNTHFDEWKNRLTTLKFSEHLAEYLRKERSSLKIVARPFDLSSLS